MMYIEHGGNHWMIEVEEIFNVPENAEVWNRLFLLVESANKGVDNVSEI